jgi:hypothetical protein
MRIGRSGWRAPAVAGATTVVIVAALALNVVNQRGGNAGLTPQVSHDIVFTFWGAAYAAVGALIVLLRPGNRVGWLLLGAGFVFAEGSLVFEYANLAAGPRHLPGGTLALWLNNSVPAIALALIPLALLVFPDGRLPGPRWRPLAWLCAAAVTCIVVGFGLDPGVLDPASPVTNPIGIAGMDGVLVAVQAVGWMLVVVAFVGAGYAAVVRLRRSGPAMRQQVKWVAYAAAVLGVLWAQFTVVNLWPVHDRVVVDIDVVVVTLSMAGVPAAMGIAILRHRLFDIDLIIRRTLVYALLVAGLSTVYAGGVLGLSAALRTVSGGTSALVVTLSTLAVAAAFQPLRVRLQHVVDHRFYRDKYDAAKTLDAFGRRLREQVDLDALRAGILEVVETTVQPRQATLWLAPAAGEPDDVSPGAPAARPAAG